MPDVEKVVRGLEHCCLDDESYPSCNGCPYGPCNVRCGGDLHADALALLKAQEQEIEDLKQEIEGHKDNLRETLDEMMRYADELKAREPSDDWISRNRLKNEIQYYIDEAGWGEEINKVLGWCLEFIDNQEAVKWE